MKKTTSKLLMILNIVVVLFLMIASLSMLFLTHSHQNYQLQLITNTSATGNSEVRLALLKTGNTQDIQKDNIVLINVNDSIQIATVDRLEDTEIHCFNDFNEQFTVSIDSSDYIGTIILSNNLLGQLISSIADENTISLKYVIIVGVFVLSLLVLMLLYLLYRRKLLLIKEQGAEEMQLFDEDESSSDYDEYVFGESLDDDVEPNIQIEEVLDEHQFCKNLQTIRVDDESVPPIQDLTTTSQDSTIPLYYLLDDDVPELDSLLSSIDHEFNRTKNWKQYEDIDIRIFPPKG